METDVADWWDKWREEDFTWDGLAEKGLDGWLCLSDGSVVEKGDGVEGENATLQDYWRDQEHDLINNEETGEVYTRIHLPLTWKNGAPTGKEDWKEGDKDFEVYEKCLKAKLNAGDRAQLWGVVLLEFNIRNITVGVDLSESEKPTLIDADFSFAAFSGNARFDNAAFSGDAWFSNAAFSRDAWFSNAAFSRDAGFDNAAFSGYAGFSNAAFSGGAGFDKAAFSRDAVFEDAAFSGNARFDKAAFSRDARFDNAAFSGVAWFDNAAFSEDAGFYNVAFSGAAMFYNAAFSGGAVFEDAAFSEDAGFYNAVFVGVASFSGDGAVLSTPETSQAIALKGRPQDGAQDIIGELNTPAQLTPLARRAFEKIEATGAVFLDDAKFDNRDILEPSSFRDAHFYGRAIFHGSKLHHGVSFHNARFEDSLMPENAPQNESALLQIIPERALNRLFEARQRCGKIRNESEQSEAGWRAKFLKKLQERVDKFNTLPQSKNNDENNETKDTYFSDLEDCFRTLKLIMEERRDRPLEGRFFRLELQARRKRRDEAVPFWERVFSDVYGLSSDYGNSALRPVVGLFLVTVPAFALLYALMGGLWVGWPALGAWGDALSFSFSRILPFGPWADQPDPCGMIGAMLEVPLGAADCVQPNYKAGTPLGLRLLASFQSFVAIVLVFLAGLAIRRRFQIS